MEENVGSCLAHSSVANLTMASLDLPPVYLRTDHLCMLLSPFAHSPPETQNDSMSPKRGGERGAQG